MTYQLNLSICYKKNNISKSWFCFQFKDLETLETFAINQVKYIFDLDEDEEVNLYENTEKYDVFWYEHYIFKEIGIITREIMVIGK